MPNQESDTGLLFNKISYSKNEYLESSIAIPISLLGAMLLDKRIDAYVEGKRDPILDERWENIDGAFFALFGATVWGTITQLVANKGEGFRANALAVGPYLIAAIYSYYQFYRPIHQDVEAEIMRAKERNKELEKHGWRELPIPEAEDERKKLYASAQTKLGVSVITAAIGGYLLVKMGTKTKKDLGGISASNTPTPTQHKLGFRRLQFK